MRVIKYRNKCVCARARLSADGERSLKCEITWLQYANVKASLRVRRAEKASWFSRHGTAVCSCVSLNNFSPLLCCVCVCVCWHERRVPFGNFNVRDVAIICSRVACRRWHCRTSQKMCAINMNEILPKIDVHMGKCVLRSMLVYTFHYAIRVSNGDVAFVCK